jgi:NADH-quinone oxidoreductase subunit M
MNQPIPLLSTIIFLPAVAAGAILLMRKEEERSIRMAALTATIVTFFASLPLFFVLGTGASPAGGAFRLRESLEWVRPLGIRYSVGVDGISAMLILLTTFLGPLTVLCSWTSVEKRVKEFFAALLFLQSGVTGVFAATDLVLFYVFWEVMLVPMFLLIGVWGGEQRLYATVKFFLYTVVGSLLMLVALVYVYWRAGARTFDMEAIRLALNPPGGAAVLGAAEQWWLFLGFSIAFVIKVPLFPFHTWLPDAHTEAPTAGSVVLAGVLLKMGTYGLLRISFPYFPGAAIELQPLLIALSIIGIIYGAFMALAQTDMKRLIAYSSVSHLGFVVLGIAAWNEKSVTGAVYQMLGHGLSTGALFLFVGAIYERRHTRRIADYGGVAKAAPGLATVFLISSLSSMGLPGLNGFVGEFLILLGSFQQNQVAAALAALGVVLGAAYLLILYQRIMLGEPKSDADRTTEDLRPREWATFVPIIAAMVVMGIFPAPFLDRLAGSVHQIVSSTPLRGM